MNQKGFTLFTAMISFLLIILAALLVNSMITAERDIKDTVGEVRVQMEMESIADLARGDAIQVFNYGLRFTIEEWLVGNPQRFYAPDYEWDDIKDGFASRNFGGCVQGSPGCRADAFAYRVAAHLLAILESRTDFGSYDMTVRKDRDELRAAMEQVMFDSAQKNDFFDVYECEETANFQNCVGTFYVTLDTSTLAPQDFEKLPMMTISNRATGRSIEKAVLQKGSFQIYIPLRLFKAFKGANLIAEGNGNNGVFTDNFRNIQIKPVHNAVAATSNDAASNVDAAVKQRFEDRIDQLIANYSLANAAEDFYLEKYDIYLDIGKDDAAKSATLEGVTIELEFREKNPDYMVNSLNGANQVYEIEITDSRPY